MKLHNSWKINTGENPDNLGFGNNFLDTPNAQSMKENTKLDLIKIKNFHSAEVPLRG